MHLSLVPGVTTAIMPTSEKVSTPSRVLTLQPTLWTSYWTNSSSKVDTKVPCLTKSSILIVHCTSWNNEKIRGVVQCVNEEAREEIVMQLNQRTSCKAWTFSAGLIKTKNRIRIDYFCDWYVIEAWHEKLRSSHFRC